MSSNSNFYPNNGGSEAFVINLYQDPSGNNLGSEVTYCDLIYMLSGDTDFSTYTFQNSGSADKTIQVWFQTNNLAQTLCDSGNGFVSTLVLTPTGATITPTNITLTNNGYAYNYTVGDGFVSTIFRGFYTGCTLTHTTNTGAIGNSISGITFNVGYDVNVTGDVYQLTNYSGLTYYIDGTSNLFHTANTLTLSASSFNYTYPSSQFMDDFRRVGALLQFDPTTGNARMLSTTGLTSTHLLPLSTGSWSTTMGSDKFMYTYFNSSGNTTVELYDFNFNLLNSEVLPYTSWWTTDSCGERFITVVNENNRYYIYMVSENVITSTTLADNNSYRTPNDIVYYWC